MAAFISSTWQGTSTRIPGERIKLPEWMTERVIQQVLPRCTPQTREEANALMSGKIDSLSFGASLELKTFVLGYVHKSDAGR